MKDSRRSSFTYTESLFLHVAKHNCFLFQFFFLSGFFSRIFSIHRTVGEVGDYLLISFLPLPTASQALRHQLGYCCRELTSVHSWQPETNMESLVHFRIHSFYTCTGSLRGECLKTQVTLGNISRLLLNLTKRLIFAMFKNSSSLPVFAQLTVIFSSK